MRKYLVCTITILLFSTIFPLSPNSLSENVKSWNKNRYIKFALKNGIEDSIKADYLYSKQVNIQNKRKFDKLDIDLNKYASHAERMMQMPTSSFYDVLDSDIIIIGDVQSKTYTDENLNPYYGTIYEINVKEILYNPKEYKTLESQKVYLFQQSGEFSRVSSDLKCEIEVGEQYLFFCSKQPIITLMNFIENKVTGYENVTLPHDISDKNYFLPASARNTSEIKKMLFTNGKKKISYKSFRKKVKQLDIINNQVNFNQREYSRLD